MCSRVHIKPTIAQQRCNRQLTLTRIGVAKVTNIKFRITFTGAMLLLAGSLATVGGASAHDHFNCNSSCGSKCSQHADDGYPGVKKHRDICEQSLGVLYGECCDATTSLIPAVPGRDPVLMGQGSQRTGHAEHVGMGDSSGPNCETNTNRVVTPLLQPTSPAHSHGHSHS